MKPLQRLLSIALIVLLCWPSVSLAISLSEVRSGTEDGSDGNLALAAQNLAAGSLNIACVKWEGSVSLSSITDTAGNTYTLHTNQTHSLSEPSVRCGSVLSASGNASNIVTFNFSGSASFKRGVVYEFTYSGTAGLDVERGSTESDSDTTPSSDTVTTTGTEEVCVAIHGDYQGHTFSNHTINGSADDGNTDMGDTSAWYKIFASTFSGGASSLTRSGSARWVQRLQCYKITAGGGGSVVRSLGLLGVGQ